MYSVSRIICQPFINEPPSNKGTLNTALSFARSECDKLHQKTCFVTFDQPLYHKARIIIAESQERGKLKNVVVRLGGFHLLMSYLGAIGYIMADSGLEALWSIVYAPQSVKQMLSGHAFARAMRAHILTFTALGIAVAKSATSDKTCEHRDYMSSFLKDWQCESAQPLTFGDCQADPVVAEMTGDFIAEVNRLKNNGPTAQLWLQYFELVTIALQFVEAERLGDWKLHLQCVNQMLPIFHAAGHLPYAKSAQIYLQDMAALEYSMDHAEYDKFTKEGFFTIRRSDKPWSGVWSDMTIEQTLNRYFGTDLKHGRGITAGVIARYLLAMPSTFNIMECVEEFLNIQTISSEQHKDLSASRQKRDDEDLNKFLSWIDSHQPFQLRDNLMSLSTGMYGTEIDCHLAIAKGRQGMLSMLGQNARNISLSMLNKVKNLASLKASIHLADTPHLAVDSALLFQRISVVFQGDSAQTRNAFDYELAPYPLTLFDEKGFMRKTSKADLYKVFKKYTSHIHTEIFLESFVFVLDGGFLLQSVCWPHGVTYRDIFRRYLDFIVHHYRGKAYVVFDGYHNDSLGVKSYERYRRGETNFTANIDFTEDMLLTVTQKKFLSNIGNKYRFIKMLSRYLQDNNVQVAIAPEDADTLIVNTAIKVNRSMEGHVAVVGNDTDLLVLLVALNKYERKTIFLYKIVPGKTKDLYSTADQDEFKEFILFAHAFAGCDTTSSMYMKGKRSLLTLLQKNQDLQNLAKVFYDPQSEIDAICSAAETFVLHLYGYYNIGNNNKQMPLGEARYKKFVSSTATGTSTMRLAKLPPTSAALNEHAKRVYLQVQSWLGNILLPENWGWKRRSSILFPIMSTASPAPRELLKLVRSISDVKHFISDWIIISLYRLSYTNHQHPLGYYEVLFPKGCYLYELIPFTFHHLATNKASTSNGKIIE